MKHRDCPREQGLPCDEHCRTCDTHSAARAFCPKGDCRTCHGLDPARDGHPGFDSGG